MKACSQSIKIPSGLSPPLSHFETGKIYEIFGRPGIGKTQLCLQLCLNLQRFSHDSPTAFYFDTEGGFSMERVIEMATSLAPSDSFSEPIEISNIRIFRTFGLLDFMRNFKDVENYIDENSNVKLIVIDSLSFPIRCFGGTMTERNRLIKPFLQKLVLVAIKFALVIVVVNHVTTRRKNDNTFRIESKMGLNNNKTEEEFESIADTRIKMNWVGNKRMATNVKSGEAKPFRIDGNGVFPEIKTIF
ncbi:DNA repair protein rad51c [Bonamia ostreae]|uniref:DNA repair protein RAD51 homolog 3 n=1 Tax=Bonamia ostreae TaxID=126728 RepID=A0ABV2ALY6_9EUKA